MTPKFDWNVDMDGKGSYKARKNGGRKDFWTGQVCQVSSSLTGQSNRLHQECLAKIKKPAYFTIQLIFTIIHGPHCTFWYYSWVALYISTNFYLYVQCFQFQQNKQIPNKPYIFPNHHRLTSSLDWSNFVSDNRGSVGLFGFDRSWTGLHLILSWEKMK